MIAYLCTHHLPGCVHAPIRDVASDHGLNASSGRGKLYLQGWNACACLSCTSSGMQPKLRLQNALASLHDLKHKFLTRPSNMYSHSNKVQREICRHFAALCEAPFRYVTARAAGSSALNIRHASLNVCQSELLTSLAISRDILWPFAVSSIVKFLGKPRSYAWPLSLRVVTAAYQCIAFACIRYLTRLSARP